jgi:hypothetical protein
MPLLVSCELSLSVMRWWLWVHDGGYASVDRFI